MILSTTLSKPTAQVEANLGRNYRRVKIRFNGAGERPYFAEFFTEKQAFHKHFSESEFEEFLKNNIGLSFKNCVERTEESEITLTAGKNGKILRRERKIQKTEAAPAKGILFKPGGREKNYIIKEGSDVPFLQALGVMTSGGKVVAAKYDKFRQVNRFLEVFGDILPQVLKMKGQGQNAECQNFFQAQEGGALGADNNLSQAQEGGRPIEPLQILDFGSGKSYLTFAVQYYLEKIKNIPCQITGVDLKEDVVKNCSDLARRLDIKNINFVCGDIARYDGKNTDIVISLHACDTATDYALFFAVQRKAKAILSVPCCQREINSQLSKNSNEDFAPLLKHGIFRERFSALLTDAVRGELLEECGYAVQVLEFIDMEGTPKNLMIRALLKDCGFAGGKGAGVEAEGGAVLGDGVFANGGQKISRPKLLENFGLEQKLFSLLTLKD